MEREIPKGWRFKHNAWYYSVPKTLRNHWDNKTEYRLGKNVEEAWATWDSKTILLPDKQNGLTIGQLLDKYIRDVVCQKSYKSQESNRISIARIKGVFGQMRVQHLKATSVAQYRDRVAVKHGATSANRDLEVISHLYTKACEWGVVDNHPTKGAVTKLKLTPRDRYVEDWEIAEALKVANPTLIAYFWLKLATGQRRKDLLSLKLDDIRSDSDGIRFKPSKTSRSSGRKVIVLWTDDLRTWRDYALSIRPESHDSHVLLNSKGQGWLNAKGQANGFDTMWQRFMDAALSQTNLTQRFQERDLRAKTASDTDLQHASRLLAHTSEQITQMVYRRKGDAVQPVDVARLFKYPKT